MDSVSIIFAKCLTVGSNNMIIVLIRMRLKINSRLARSHLQLTAMLLASIPGLEGREFPWNFGSSAAFILRVLQVQHDRRFSSILMLVLNFQPELPRLSISNGSVWQLYVLFLAPATALGISSATKYH